VYTWEARRRRIVFPYFEIPPVTVGPLRLHLFGLLIALGVGAGYYWFRRRVQRTEGDSARVPGMVFWMLAAGFVGAVLFKLPYSPDFFSTLTKSPGTLVRLSGGIASFGGLFAGLVAGCLYLWRTGLGALGVLRYLDALAFVFPRAWLFGRMGCALTHDHPGIRTESWLGVQYPGGTRFDLGLIEVFFLIAYIVLLVYLDRVRRPVGFYLGLFLATYGMFRLLLDTLHEEVILYLGWTVDQYASTLAVLAGLAIFAASRRARRAASVSNY